MPMTQKVACTPYRSSSLSTCGVYQSSGPSSMVNATALAGAAGMISSSRCTGCARGAVADATGTEAAGGVGAGVGRAEAVGSAGGTAAGGSG